MNRIQRLRKAYDGLSEAAKMKVTILGLVVLIAAVFTFCASDTGKKLFRPKLYWTEQKAQVSYALQNVQSNIRLAEVVARFDREQAHLNYRREMALLTATQSPQDAPDTLRLLSETHQHALERALADINEETLQRFKLYQVLLERDKDIDSKLASFKAE